MAMPAFIYHWYFGAHGLKSLERSILRFVGIRPIRETFIGMIANADEGKRKARLEKLRGYGARRDDVCPPAAEQPMSHAAATVTP